ncbi:hypothetical protein KAI87_03635 [Myxococcota bacterium]|nr:hypothetical protein [Myxococcota bacterium]
MATKIIKHFWLIPVLPFLALGGALSACTVRLGYENTPASFGMLCSPYILCTADLMCVNDLCAECSDAADCLDDSECSVDSCVAGVCEWDFQFCGVTTCDVEQDCGDCGACDEGFCDFTDDLRCGDCGSCNAGVCDFTDATACGECGTCNAGVCDFTDDSGCGECGTCDAGVCDFTDCSDFCGNNIVDSGETCDGNCPVAADCVDTNACTVDSILGSASSCSTECIYEEITHCIDDDGCCPGDCSSDDDNDCVPVVEDNTPDSFMFSDEGVGLSTLVESTVVRITGINVPSAVFISGDGAPAYRICSDSVCSSVAHEWSISDDFIVNEEYLQIRLTSNAVQNTVNSAQITVGTHSDTWEVTTVAGWIYIDTWNLAQTTVYKCVTGRGDVYFRYGYGAEDTNDYLYFRPVYDGSPASCTNPAVTSIEARQKCVFFEEGGRWSLYLGKPSTLGVDFPESLTQDIGNSYDCDNYTLQSEVTPTECKAAYTCYKQ